MPGKIKHYTGVGSRETPPEICKLISEFARILAGKGWALRSGHADGADKAFHEGHVLTNVEPFPPASIFLPWQGFNGCQQENDTFINAKKLDNYAKAQEIAQSIIPWWDNIKQGGRALHTRNVYQVLGVRLDNPSERVVCWGIPDKHNGVKGGTGTAYRLAERYEVPILNLYYKKNQEKVIRFIEQNPEPANELGYWARDVWV